ncbi:MAG: hypothetical protein SynsKO_41520 [Synoicihabitans sp.]
MRSYPRSGLSSATELSISISHSEFTIYLPQRICFGLFIYPMCSAILPPTILNRRRASSWAQGGIFLVFALAAHFACAQNEPINFMADVQPIIERLPAADRDTLLNWLEQGGELPADYAAISDSDGELHGEALFEFEIAPILAHHCLECHDTGRREGALDLSRKAAAFRGGDSGVALIPGDSAESDVYDLVLHDEMPEDRPPLSAREKALLKRWIDEGAVWSVDWIDPAIYENEGGGASWIRRLTVTEYIETVRSAVGVDIAAQASELLPPDLRADGFSNTAYNLNVDMGHVTAYAELAALIVSQIETESFARQFHQAPKFTDKDMGILIKNLGKHLFRGPLTEEEVIAFRGISTTVASAGGSIGEAVGYLTEAMLQSPRFIYRIESQPQSGGSSRVSDYELASRLSYAIWGAPPDKPLMQAAEDGELSDPDRLDNEVSRLLADPRARRRSAEFAHEWLNLGRMDSLRPNPKKFPEWQPNLAHDMRAETLAFFEEVVWNQQRPLANLLNAQVTFLTPSLAQHYGLPSPSSDSTNSKLQRLDLSEHVSRGGLLTHGSVLTMGGDEASMVTRGLFVLGDLLRGTVKDPPPCLDTTPVPSSPGQSQRVIAEERVAAQACGGCHEKFEPLAYGLEQFDGLGAFHEKDVFGNILREDGEILFPGAAQPEPYETSAELMDLLAQSDRVAETLTWKIAQYVFGRPLGARDAIEMKTIHESAQQNGGTYQALLHAISTSPLMRAR